MTAGRRDKRGGGTRARSPKKSTPKEEFASGGSRTGAWTSEEDWKLFQHIYPRVTPNWAEVARDIGRDAKVGMVKRGGGVGNTNVADGIP